MARFTRKRITKADAATTLETYASGIRRGSGWEISEIGGRPFASTVYLNSYSDIRRDLISAKGIEFRTTDGQVITDQPFWPNHLHCKIDLADFFVDENNVVQHPLCGFHIKKLIEATHYPFYHQDRVTVIPIRFSKTLVLNPQEPDAVMFIEHWSHFDNYDIINYRSPSEAFKIPLVNGTLWSSQLEDQKAHVGKNFIILPFGYCYDEAMEERDRFTTEEWNQLCTKNAAEWTQIIQDFLDGKDDEDGSVNETDDRADSIVEEIQPTDNSLFDRYQKRQRNIWQGQFLCEHHIKLCEKFEYILKEREDKNGVQVWRVAQPSDRTDCSFNTSFFEELIEIDGVQYRMASFIYCAEHYATFLAFLKAADDRHQELATRIKELSPKD